MIIYKVSNEWGRVRESEWGGHSSVMQWGWGVAFPGGKSIMKVYGSMLSALGGGGWGQISRKNCITWMDPEDSDWVSEPAMNTVTRH